jgi:hypothetical protein
MASRRLVLTLLLPYDGVVGPNVVRACMFVRFRECLRSTELKVCQSGNQLQTRYRGTRVSPHPLIRTTGVGLLGRWQVRAKTLQPMGKEIDREVVAGESFAEITPEPQLTYEPVKHNSVVNKRTLDPIVIEQLRSKYPSMRKSSEARQAQLQNGPAGS